MVPVARTEITPGAAGWQDVDVTALLGADAGDVAGVVLEAVNTGAAVPDFGVRNNGSGDTLENRLWITSHMWVAVGIDANDIFECKVGDIVDIDVYIVGYILNSEGSFFPNFIAKNIVNPNVWEDIDISADTGGETAVCAFFWVRNNSGSLNQEYGFRENGSGDDRHGDLGNLAVTGAMMSVDANEIVECWAENIVTIKPYLTGYLTANFANFVNARNYSTGVLGAWTDVNMGGDIPVGWDGACLHFYQADSLAGGIRKKGEVYDNYYDLKKHILLWVEIDANRFARQKIENVSIDLWLWGYTGQGGPAPNPPTAPTGLQVAGQSSPTGENCISGLTPGFTAIFNDPDADDISNAINIQIGTASGLSDMWDSGWLADSTVTPNRCTAKTYAGAALSTGTSYFWRCRFRDDGGLEGAWSAWQQFDICEEVPAEIPLQCVPGGPLPRRRPFTCAVRVPLLEPGRRFPFEFPISRSPCN